MEWLVDINFWYLSIVWYLFFTAIKIWFEKISRKAESLYFE